MIIPGEVLDFRSLVALPKGTVLVVEWYRQGARSAGATISKVRSVVKAKKLGRQAGAEITLYRLGEAPYTCRVLDKGREMALRGLTLGHNLRFRVANSKEVETVHTRALRAEHVSTDTAAATHRRTARPVVVAGDMATALLNALKHSGHPRTPSGLCKTAKIAHTPEVVSTLEKLWEQGKVEAHGDGRTRRWSLVVGTPKAVAKPVTQVADAPRKKKKKKKK